MPWNMYNLYLQHFKQPRNVLFILCAKTLRTCTPNIRFIKNSTERIHNRAYLSNTYCTISIRIGQFPGVFRSEITLFEKTTPD